MPVLEYTYNSTQHSSTKAAPFDLLYGFVPPKPICRRLNIPTIAGGTALPFQARVKLGKAKQKLARAQAYQKRHADKSRRPVEYHAGQNVWLTASGVMGVARH